MSKQKSHAATIGQRIIRSLRKFSGDMSGCRVTRIVRQSDGTFKRTMKTLSLWLLLAATCWGQSLPPADVAAFKRLLPEIDSVSLRELCDSPRTFWYDARSLGVAYQIGDTSIDTSGRSTRFRDAMQNISGDNGPHNARPAGYGGNPNVKGAAGYPWSAGTAGGTSRCVGTDSVKAMLLPLRDDGKPWPVVTFHTTVSPFFPNQRSDPRQRVMAWTFPVGCVFAEFITQRDPHGDVWIFEIRTRTREYGGWSIDIFKPYPKAEHLATDIKELRPKWKENTTLAKLVQYLDGPGNVVSKRLRDNDPRHTFANRTKSAFDVRTGTDELPPAGDDDLVRELLGTEFVSAHGTDWRVGCPAPTTEAKFHIIPARYDGAFVGNSLETCSKCHSSGSHSGREFNRGIDWYGRLRGAPNKESAGGSILSWNPIDRRTLNGTPRFNEVLLKSGMLARYDKSAHPERLYQFERDPD